MAIRPFSALFLLGALYSSSVAGADDGVAARKAYDPHIELPQSEGRELVLRACTLCHELRGLAGYRGYWGLPQWQEMVTDMVKHGAVLTPAEQELVAAYLTRHFGPSVRNPE
ncbi:MAG: hypothetical protein LBF16_09810 [Pseudomonadales bacterium]|jgi:hypothetical protein|nr:hypothetical protein [Pseudomonadales bacterium]